MTRRGRLHQRRRPQPPDRHPAGRSPRHCPPRWNPAEVIEDAILLLSLPFPLTAAELVRARGSRPAGPAPQPAAELLRVERRVSCRGAIMVAKQRIHVGIQHAGKTVAVEVDDGTFTVQHGPDILPVVGRTSRKEVARFKPASPKQP